MHAYPTKKSVLIKWIRIAKYTIHAIKEEATVVEPDTHNHI